MGMHKKSTKSGVKGTLVCLIPRERDPLLCPLLGVCIMDIPQHATDCRPDGDTEKG
jgi:hypothetical protein